MLEKAVTFSHTLLKGSVRPGDTVIDATVGKGNDTLFLGSLVGETGRVLGFDIQEDALAITKQKCIDAGIEARVALHLTSHEHARDYLASDTELGGVIYNLGYLPGGDKSITTLPKSTINSVKGLLPKLRTGSLMILVVYSGHLEGLEEKNHVLNFVTQLDQTQFSVLRYEFINQRNNPPFVLAIEKKAAGK